MQLDFSLFSRSNLLKLSLSTLLAIIFLVIAYLVMNLSFTLPQAIEKPKLRLFEDIRQFCFGNSSSESIDSVVFIDVSNDQTLVMEYDVTDDGSLKPNGDIPVCNHEKLLRLLRQIKENGNYRYVMLDTHFDSYMCRQSVDSALFATIVSMDNIVISKSQYPIADSCLLPKAAVSAYGITSWNNGFTKYPYVIDGEISVPMRMYMDLNNGNIFKLLPFLWWDKGIARNSVFLTFEIREPDKRSLDSFAKMGRILGDTIDGESYINRIRNNPRFTQNKYIIIGDFKNDIHATFLGPMSGPVINYNAYKALVDGQHRFGVITILLLLVMLASFCYVCIYGNNLTSKLVKPIKFIVRPKIIPIFLGFLCLGVYLIWHVVYDIYVFVLLFWSLNMAVSHGFGRTKFVTAMYFLILLLVSIGFILVPEKILAIPALFIAIILPIVTEVKTIFKQQKK